MCRERVVWWVGVRSQQQDASSQRQFGQVAKTDILDLTLVFNNLIRASLVAQW